MTDGHCDASCLEDHMMDSYKPKGTMKPLEDEHQKEQAIVGAAGET